MLDLATIGVGFDTKDLKEGQKELDKTGASASKAADAADKTSGSFKNMAAAFAGGMLAANAVELALRQVGKAMNFLEESAKMAARFETMGVVMGIAGNNAGYTRAQMELLSKTLQGSGISMLQSRDALTQLATANIDLAKASEIGRAAQDLAVVGNINSSEAMGRMIHGIKSGEVEILRTLGLNVNFEMSYQRMAVQLKKNSNELTEHEKMLARTNAALTAAAAYNGIYEESMGTAGKQMKSMERYWEDLKVKLGEAFLPALTTQVFNTAESLKDMNKQLTDAGQSGLIADVGGALNGVLVTGLQTVSVLGANVSFVFKAMGRDIGAIAAQAAAVGRLDFAGAALIGREVTADAEAARKALDDYEKKVLGVSATQSKVAKVSEEDRMKAGKAMRDQAEADEKAFAALKKAQEQAKKTEEAYKGFASALNIKINEQNEELGTGIKLTESDKLRIKFMEELGNKMKGLSGPRQKEINDKIDDIAIGEMLIAQRKRDIEAIKTQMAVREEQSDDYVRVSKLTEQMRLGVDEYVKGIDEETAKLEIQAQMRDKATSEVQKALAVYQIQLNLKKQLADIDKTETVNGETDREEMRIRARAAAFQAEKNAIMDTANGYQQYLSSMGTETERIASATSKAFKGMEDALVGFVTTGKLDFKSLANSIIADMVRIQIQQSITSPLAQGMNSGGFDGLFNSALGLFGQGKFIEGSSSFVGPLQESFMQPLKPFANGGDPPVGVPSLVGERGPELFVPKSAGTIVPNGQLGGTTFAPRTSINIDARTDKAEVFSLVSNVLAQNNRDLIGMLKQSGMVPA